MSNDSPKSLRVLFLCTHNANRSQMAEAILDFKARKLAPGRIVVGSAGSAPAKQVNPWAIKTLASHGIKWEGHTPRSIDEVIGVPWDLVITVCDSAKEACPVIPGQPAFAHWGMDDPSEADDARKERAYGEAFAYLSRQIDLLLAQRDVAR